MGAKVYTFLGFIQGKYIGAATDVYRTRETCQQAIDGLTDELAGQPIDYKILELELKDE